MPMPLEIVDHFPKKGSRIVVAMSGGVDSSVSAAWLKKLGYDVIGISLQLHDKAEQIENKFGTCCSLTDISDARRVAEKMDFPFYVNNMESEFEEGVIDNFVSEYLNGRTPNPCVKCNEKVKFRALMDWAMDLGADYLATGHFANVRFDPSTNYYSLCKGADLDKDQSYFLFTLKQEDLKRIMFPVGGLKKMQVREIATELGLTGVAKKPDSQEICFVQDKSYREFIESRVPASMLTQGPILHIDGQVIGQHEGLHHYTLGQRKGIKVASSEALFVLEMNSHKNTLVVGPEEHLFKKKCMVSSLNWVMPPQIDIRNDFEAKIRYRAKESRVTIEPLIDNKILVEFESPQRAITPGQALVLYRGDEVFGGGWIESML